MNPGFRNFFALISLAVAGCSSGQNYHALQSMEQSRCAKMPANQYPDCLQQSDASYKEYETARREGKTNS